ncbi:MAG TPA: SprT family zinc-dependent metalloprotease [Caldisericia bacterium]|nr:SprT family zinc-dependent metalloprotease [Caldisericia bacterium]
METDITFQHIVFPVTIHHSRRKTLSITLRKPNHLVVRVPMRTKLQECFSFLQSREKWVMKHYCNWMKNPIQYIEYKDGATIPILGENVLLRIEQHEKKKNEVYWYQNQIIVKCKDLEEKTIRATMQNWFKKEATHYLLERIQYLLSIHPFLPHPMPSGYRFRRMKRRWGSCSTKGVITLNTELWKASPEAIDYVIIHEICHLQHMNHGKEFKRYLTSLCPNWKTDKHLLKNIPQW